MHTRSLVLVAAIVAVAALTPGRASAHDLQLVVKLPPDAPTVLIAEAGFDDQTPAGGAVVTIADLAGKVIAEGKTNEKGLWQTARPGGGKYVAKVEAYGHTDAVEFEIARSDTFEFRGWRLDKTLGMALGVGGLLVLSFGFWWFRLRKSA